AEIQQRFVAGEVFCRRGQSQVEIIHIPWQLTSTSTNMDLVHDKVKSKSKEASRDFRRPAGVEAKKWFESLEFVLEYALKNQDPAQAELFVESLVERLRASGVEVPNTVNTPYVNTIPVEDQPAYPGDRDLERRIKSYVRWNAMAMVVNANR